VAIDPLPLRLILLPSSFLFIIHFPPSFPVAQSIIAQSSKGSLWFFHRKIKIIQIFPLMVGWSFLEDLDLSQLYLSTKQKKPKP
jgi:hypothetical protein